MDYKNQNQNQNLVQIMDYILANTTKWAYPAIWTAHLVNALVNKDTRLFFRLIPQALDTELTVSEVDIYKQFFEHECDQCLRAHGPDVLITFIFEKSKLRTEKNFARLLERIKKIYLFTSRIYGY